MPEFKTGTKVICKDFLYFDEEVPGFIAKQIDDEFFLVKLARPFSRRATNDGKVWMKVSREFGHQVVREK